MLLSQLTALVADCDEDERDLIEKMVLSCGEYVRAVTEQRTKALNFGGRTGEALRNAVESADRERTNCHNAVIAYTDIVNRLCTLHGQAAIYTGSSARREYGDFAIALVSEIFAAR